MQKILFMNTVVFFSIIISSLIIQGLQGDFRQKDKIFSLIGRCAIPDVCLMTFDNASIATDPSNPNAK